MLPLRLLAFLAVMPFLAKAEMFGFFACGDFLHVIDRMAQTHGGAEQFMSFLGNSPKVVLWNPNNREDEFKCFQMNLVDGVFSLEYFDKEDVRFTHQAIANYTTYPTAVLDIKPSNSKDATPIPLGVLSATRQGAARMFPLYISDTEAIVLNCLNTFWGHVYSVYVLSTQDLSAMDGECAASNVRESIGITVTPSYDKTECDLLQQLG